MSIETTADWDGLRRVGRVVALTLDALEAAVEPGITTGDLDRIAARIFDSHGAASAPALTYGFPGTRDRSLAAHCEHTLVVTADGPVVLTALAASA